MKKYLYSLLFVFCFISVFWACNRNNTSTIKNKDAAQIEVIENLKTIDSLALQGIYDTTSTNQFIASALSFAKLHPEEEIVPEFLLNAALSAMNIARMTSNESERAKYAKKAIHILHEIEKVYPDYKGVKYCYLYRGETYDDILKDYKSAEIEYRTFIHKYPNDSLSSNLRVYIDHLGKTPEEIMEDIQKKN